MYGVESSCIAPGYFHQHDILRNSFDLMKCHDLALVSSVSIFLHGRCLALGGYPRPANADDERLSAMGEDGEEANFLPD